MFGRGNKPSDLQGQIRTSLELPYEYFIYFMNLNFSKKSRNHQNMLESTHLFAALIEQIVCREAAECPHFVFAVAACQTCLKTVV